MAGWSLALIGNASAHKIEARTARRAEAFSIRRLEGSRWRLRRTRQLWGFNAALVPKDLTDWDEESADHPARRAAVGLGWAQNITVDKPRSVFTSARTHGGEGVPGARP